MTRGKLEFEVFIKVSHTSLISNNRKLGQFGVLLLHDRSTKVKGNSTNRVEMVNWKKREVEGKHKLEVG